MKTAKEVIKAMESCISNDCTLCPYDDINTCSTDLIDDAFDALTKLEEENRALRTELAANGKDDVSETNVGDIPDQKPKSDAGKPRLTLVPPKIIWDIAAVRQYGVEVKYPETGMDGWRTIGVQRIRDALCRHLLAYLATPHGKDPESGLPILWHCACNIAFLCELEGEDT